MIWDMLADIRYGARAVRARPTFAAVVVLTLALGIGATTVIFSVVNAVLVKPLPYASPDRLVRIFENVPAGEVPGIDMPMRIGINVAELDDWRNAETLSHVAIVDGLEGRIQHDDISVRAFLLGQQATAEQGWNVANLMLVRGTQRQREIEIRRSLGATRGRIIRLVLAESLTLAGYPGGGRRPHRRSSRCGRQFLAHMASAWELFAQAMRRLLAA